MQLLADKCIVVTGVLTASSLAHATAALAIEQGAQVVLTTPPATRRTTERAARSLPGSPDVIDLDIGDPGQVAALTEALDERWGRVDGALHAIGYAPPVCLGGTFLDAGWDDVGTAVHLSAYSLKALADAVRPLMPPGSALVGLDFDASVTWPAYDWMGVAKAALESTSRYLATYLGPDGIRVNLVAAGPTRTVAARSIPGFGRFESVWDERAPLGWDVRDRDATARACVALLSDWFPMTTGEIIHVDGGFHATGA